VGERSLLQIPRGLNKLWRDGGLLYAIPLHWFFTALRQIHASAKLNILFVICILPFSINRF
jgi:hypothetical protein